jgi:hypothetical protein
LAKKREQKNPVPMNADIWGQKFRRSSRLSNLQLTPPTIAGLHHTKLLDRRAPRIGGPESNDYNFKKFKTDLDSPIKTPIPDYSNNP